MPSSAAACRAVASEREAMPRTSIHVLFCMAGITLTFAIFAVPRIPQTTFFICAVYSRQNEQHRLQFATVFCEDLSFDNVLDGCFTNTGLAISFLSGCPSAWAESVSFHHASRPATRLLRLSGIPRHNPLRL